MRFPKIHTFLKWLGPTVVVFCGGILGLIAGLSVPFTRVKDWSEIQFDLWWPVVSAGWFLVALVLVIAAYIWALVYTGGQDKPALAQQEYKSIRKQAHDDFKDYSKRRNERAEVDSREASVVSPSPTNRACIGTIGAALIGLDAEQSRIVIDIKNFGQTPATNVRWEAVAGWFAQQPSDIDGVFKGTFGVTEQGHTQNIMLILTQPVRSADISGFVRGAAGIYALLRIDYTDIYGDDHARNIAYYIDSDGHRERGKLMLSVCPTGNNETSERKFNRNQSNDKR